MAFLRSALLWLCGPCYGAPVPPFSTSCSYHTISHIGPCWVELNCFVAGRLVKLVNRTVCVQRKQNIFRNKGTGNIVWNLAFRVSCGQIEGYMGGSGKITTCHIWIQKLTLTQIHYLD